MRLVKLSILGALLAIASSALVGSTASATTELCVGHEELACAGNPVETTHAVAGTGTVVTILGGITVLCLGALAEATVLEDGSPQKLHATSLIAFTGCGTGSSHSNCTVTVEELPSFELFKTGLDEGSLTATNGQVRLKCTNLGLNCLYDTEGLEFSAGAQHITAEESVLTELGGKFFCPDESSLDALLETLTEAFILGPNQAADGPFWYEDKEIIPAGKKVTKDVKGDMTFDIGGIIQIKECPFTASKTIFNGAKVGEDELSKVAFTVPCKTSAAECKVTKMTPQNLPWKTVLINNKPFEDKLSAFELTVTFEKNMECGPYNDKTVPIKGPVAGKIPNVSSCVEFEEAEGLMAGELAVTLTGTECFEGEAETSITVE